MPLCEAGKSSAGGGVKRESFWAVEVKLAMYGEVSAIVLRERIRPGVSGGALWRGVCVVGVGRRWGACGVGVMSLLGACMESLTPPRCTSGSDMSVSSPSARVVVLLVRSPWGGEASWGEWGWDGVGVRARLEGAPGVGEFR